jgi:hypothetical protein
MVCNASSGAALSRWNGGHKEGARSNLVPELWPHKPTRWPRQSLGSPQVTPSPQSDLSVHSWLLSISISTDVGSNPDATFVLSDTQPFLSSEFHRETNEALVHHLLSRTSNNFTNKAPAVTFICHHVVCLFLSPCCNNELNNEIVINKDLCSTHLLYGFSISREKCPFFWQKDVCNSSPSMKS